MKLIHIRKTIFLSLLLLIGLPFFFYGGPSYHSARSFQAAWNLGHILYFSLSTALLLTLIEKKVTTWPPLWVFMSLFALVLGLGVGIEFLQSITGGRSPDMEDVVRNQIGCTLAFAFFPQPQRSQHKDFFRLLKTIAILCLLPALWPVTQALIDEQTARFQFPVLADFETPFEKSRWMNTQQLNNEKSLVRHGAGALRVQLSTAKYSGTTLFHFPENWQGFSLLHWSAYNPQPEALTLTLRINDTEHKQHGSAYDDRFNKKFILQPGWNDLVVNLKQVRHAPKGRTMDMQHIESLGLFVVQQDKPKEIILDHFYLTR